MDESVFEEVRKDFIKSLPTGHVYLDHAGCTLPRSDMMERCLNDLITGATGFANPHTKSTYGRNTEDMMCNIRGKVLEFFDAEGYEVIFTSGATQAMKLVGECFPWSDESVVCYPIHSHTSLLGMRAYCRNAICVARDAVERASTGSHLSQSMSISRVADNNAQRRPVRSLLLMPGECNFTGMKENLQQVGEVINSNLIMEDIMKNGRVVKGQPTTSQDIDWLWFLDASKLAATSKISLASIPPSNQPHFMAVSFYKIFGYPTGIGALLVRKDVQNVLQKRYFGGGTAAAISALDDYVVGRSLDSLGRLFEDGTPNYHGIAALKYGFESIASMGGMESIQSYAYALSSYLASRLRGIRHDLTTNKHVVKIYGHYDNPSICSYTTQGPIVSFNLYWSDGTPVGYSQVGQLAEEHHITLRTGCFCNPGGCQEFLDISTKDIIHHYSEGRTCGSESGDIINGKVTGSIRASLGFSSLRSDCDALIQFIQTHFQNKSIANISTEGHPVNELRDIKLREIMRTKDNAPESAFDSSIARIVKSVRLTAIFVYPIKSCGGYLVPNDRCWGVTSSGLHLDRKWAVSDVKTNRILTQKNHPCLSQVRVSFNESISVLNLSHPRMKDSVDISIPSDSQITTESYSNSLKVRLCGRQQDATCSVFNASTVSISESSIRTADEWFTELIGNGITCRLVKACDAPKQNKEEKKTKANGVDIEQKSSFVNEAQILLISEESVNALNEAMEICYGNDDSNPDALDGDVIDANSSTETKSIEKQVSVENFRPNLVVCGAGVPHQEDKWSTLTLKNVIPCNPHAEKGNSIVWDVIGPCSRCSAININGTSGSIDSRILETVGKYRKYGYKINFGQFLQLREDSIRDKIGNQVDDFTQDEDDILCCIQTDCEIEVA